LVRITTLAMQRVGFFAALFRHQVVGRFKVLRLDVGQVDERQDVDGAAGLGIGAAEVLVGQHHVLLVLVLVALYHVAPGHFLARRLVDALVADRRQVALVEHRHVELSGALLGRVQLDRDVDQAEADRPFPQAACHG
jgi:hypothetical protein